MTAVTSVWFEGIDDLNTVAADLTTASGRVGTLGSMVVRKSALAIEGTAKQMAPVDTGALRSSITSSFAGDGRSGSMEAEIGPEVAYGHFVELGTSRQPPQSYLGPALDRHSGDFVAAMEAISDPLGK